MPVDGYILRAPWGAEQIYTATRDGAVAWAEALGELAASADVHDMRPADVWRLNEERAETLRHIWRRHQEVIGALDAARDFAARCGDWRIICGG